MNANIKGNKLIEDLLFDPVEFNEKGSAYELLQHYFEGFPISTLRPLLANDNYFVKRAAVWVTSELGDLGSDLIDEVIPLINFEDRYIVYQALESVMVFSSRLNVHAFIHVVSSLHSNDPVIRLLAMRLISNASDLQLQTAIKQYSNDKPYHEAHRNGLAVLLKHHEVNKEIVENMIDDCGFIINKYGAIAAKRLFKKYPELIKHAALIDDSDLRSFSERFISSELNK